MAFILISFGAETQLTKALQVLNKNTILSLGIIDGRNVWRTDLEKASLINQTISEFGEEKF